MPAKGTWFTRLSMHASEAAGKPGSFLVATAVILAWALTGPMFDFSDRWMWVVHTATSIATFLLVFLLHNTESRNTQAIQIKLDELIRSVDGARQTVLDLENLDHDQLERVHARYERIAERKDDGR